MEAIVALLAFRLDLQNLLHSLRRGDGVAVAEWSEGGQGGGLERTQRQ